MHRLGPPPLAASLPRQQSFGLVFRLLLIACRVCRTQPQTTAVMSRKLTNRKYRCLCLLRAAQLPMCLKPCLACTLVSSSPTSNKCHIRFAQLQGRKQKGVLVSLLCLFAPAHGKSLRSVWQSEYLRLPITITVMA